MQRIACGRHTRVIAIIRQDYALKDVHFVDAERRHARISRVIRHVQTKLLERKL